MINLNGNHHRSNNAVPFAKKMILAGVNFNQHQINNIIPTNARGNNDVNVDFDKAIKNSSLQFSDLINISAIDNGVNSKNESLAN